MSRLLEPLLLYRWARRAFVSHPRVRSGLLWLRGQPTRAFEPELMEKRLSNMEIGRLGEWIACRWLRSCGRRVLAQNFRGPMRGEVDIVARHGAVLTFVEVKTRTKAGLHRPADAVGWEKQQLIIRGAQEWLGELAPLVVPFRFDIVEVILTPGELPQMHVIENAFEMPDSALAGR